ncbi:MAG: hypothetical protein M3O30_02255 [Planctomycetota bacterium]|nr:hypothetical protein [Planctomycetota bacterium]
MTEAGGTKNGGTIYQFDTITNIKTTLYSFGLGTDGHYPGGTLTQSGSVFYALTGSGGTKGSGAIVQYDTTNQTETLLYSFNSIKGDGLNPSSQTIVQIGSALYGATEQGGTNYNDGTLFKYDLTTNTESVAHSFTGGNDGANANMELIHSGSMIYGLTNSGGMHNDGTIFQFDTTSNVETVLYSFAGGSDGGNPFGSVIESGSILYGMTAFGGTNNEGTVFQYDLSDNSETILHSFSGIDGSYPRSDLLLSAQTLYGTTGGGGTSDFGVLFSLTVPEPSSNCILICGLFILSIRYRGCSSRRKIALR